MNFFDSFKNLFKDTEVNPVALAALDAFDAAGNYFSSANDAIQSYTARANHRVAILIAANDLKDSDSCQEAVAAYTDPGAFTPCTEAELAAHAAAMEKLTAAFDELTSAFHTFTAVFPVGNRGTELKAAAADLYKVYCEMYSIAAEAFSKAASCGTINALKGNLLAIEDKFRCQKLEWRADDPFTANPAAAKAYAASFKAKATEDASKSKQFEQNARIAETKAQLFIAKAKAAETRKRGRKRVGAG